MENQTTVSVGSARLLSQTTDRWKLFGTREMQALAKVESSLLAGARKYIQGQGFIEINTPHITKATGSCENIFTVFPLDYFGKRSYLSQTGQLYLEVLTPSLKKVWTTIHSFRAEPDVDSRHLTEFPLIEIEFEGDFEQLLRHTESIIGSMVQNVAIERKEELELFGIGKEHIAKFMPPYKRLTYTKAIEMLNAEGMAIKFGDDIKSVHEKVLSKALGYEPFFLTHWPEEIKFFNMRRNDDDAKLVNSSDLILPFAGEAVGGAEREYRYEILKEKLERSKMYELLKEAGVEESDFNWFLEFYKNNKTSLHSGCGIGFNRVTQSLLKLEDIRACTVFPQNREISW